MNAAPALLFTAALALGGTALAADKTAADISARCGEFKSAKDKKTCKIAAKEVGKLPDAQETADVDVFLESIEDQNGQLVLSRKRAKHMRTWQRILDAETSDTVLEGKKANGKKASGK